MADSTTRTTVYGTPFPGSQPSAGALERVHAPVLPPGELRDVSAPRFDGFRLRRVRPLRWLTPLVRAFAELYEVERLADVELTVRLTSPKATLVQVRKTTSSWFVLVCADDTVYRASARNGPLFAWAARALGSCAYGKRGCTEHDSSHATRLGTDPVEIVYTRVKGAWRHAHCFEEKPYAA